MIVDTHAHLMYKEYKEELPDVLKRAEQAGVDRIINVGFNIETSNQAIEMADKFDNLYATLGIHPHDADEITPDLINKWKKIIKENKKVLAVGECGLDYYKSKTSKESQKKAFEMQLDLARDVHLPVVIHNRDADEDTMEILKKYSGEDDERRVNAVFHCFGSNVEFARKVWYEGYLISFTGTVTYPNAEELKTIISECPMDLFMVETDCPYLSPQKFRGTRNEPSYALEVVKQIAEIKNLPEKEVARISTENAEAFFYRMEKTA